MPSAAPAAKAALVAMLRTALAAESVQVTYGHPGLTVVEDLVAVMGVSCEQAPGPMRAGPRPRDETLRLTVVISCYRGGDQQEAASDRAFALLGLAEDALMSDPTLSGTVRWAQLESYDLAEADDPDLMAAGRIAEISAVVRAEARNEPTPPAP
jgi:hypothetical protein